MARPRPRELGLRPGILPPGPGNCITDVGGIGVGHVTVDRGSGPLVPGEGPVRTGVTAIIPGFEMLEQPFPAAALVINGFGKSAGLPQLQELGEIETPILLTNTMSVPLVADACFDYMLDLYSDVGISRGTVNPVVGECNDGYLNDIRGRHVSKEHVREALDLAAGHARTGGPVAGGAVGAGRGMMCLGFKGGIGAASRKAGDYLLGAMVLANFGRRHELTIEGLPLGRMLAPEPAPGCPDGSIMIILATDAPLCSRQLGRVSMRAAFGLARSGSTCAHGSGDFVIAFSTARNARQEGKSVRDPDLDQLFRSCVEATEEAIYDALFRAETVTGRDGNVGPALPTDEVMDLLTTAGYPWPAGGEG